MKRSSLTSISGLCLVALMCSFAGCGTKEEKKPTTGKKQDHWYTEGTREVKPNLDKLH